MWEMTAIEVLLEKKEVKHIKCIQAALQEQIDLISNSGGPVIGKKWESFHIDEWIIRIAISKSNEGNKILATIGTFPIPGTVFGIRKGFEAGDLLVRPYPPQPHSIGVWP